MRRPNLLRWSSWLGECLKSIEGRPQASKWDYLLAAWVRLLKITEETGTAFAFDDVSNMARLSEPHSQLTMAGLRRSAEALRRDLPWDIFDNGMFPNLSEDCLLMKQPLSNYNTIIPSYISTR